MIRNGKSFINLPAYAKLLIKDWGLRAKAVLDHDRVFLRTRRIEDNNERLNL